MGHNSLQETLFEYGKSSHARRPSPPFDENLVRDLVAKSGIYIGTTSWKYRGWEGSIYGGGYGSEAEFQKSALQEYASLLPCVGLEFTQFAWPNQDMMAHLYERAPNGFKFCAKVTKKLTQSVFPDSPIYGKWAGLKNPDFLNFPLFEKLFLEPIGVLQEKLGLLLFDFSDATADRIEEIENFFSKMPPHIQSAVESRNPLLPEALFLKAILKFGVSPGFSLSTQSASIASQINVYQQAGGLSHSHPIVALGLLRSGMNYDQALQYFQPIGRFKESYPVGINELKEIVNFALQQRRKAYILVSNRLEGSAPHTIGNFLPKLNFPLDYELQ